MTILTAPHRSAPADLSNRMYSNTFHFGTCWPMLDSDALYTTSVTGTAQAEAEHASLSASDE
jgi:hypothetical protein